MVIYILDGIGWTDGQQGVIIDYEDIQLEYCQFELTFSFNIDHKTEMFTQPVGNRNMGFTCFLLNTESFELDWQQFECPMSFPQCYYDWCVTGDNNTMVNMLSIYSLLALH